MVVLFDLDGTILGARKEKGLVREKCTQKLGLPDIENEEYYDTLREVLHNKKVDNRVPIFEEIFDDKELAREMAEIYREKSLKNAYIYPDAKEVLKKISVKKGLITNGPKSVQWEKIKEFDLEDFFDYIAVSGEIAKSKPDSEVFTHVLEELDSSPEESLYVGNVPELDVQGAKNAGLLSVLINRGDECSPDGIFEYEPDYVIKDLRDLIEIIKLEDIK